MVTANEDGAISLASRPAYAAVKGNENLKNIVVASPSYIFKNVEIAENLSDAVDWINIHPYPGMEHPETKGPGALAGFIAGAERTFGKKVFLQTLVKVRPHWRQDPEFLAASDWRRMAGL